MEVVTVGNERNVGYVIEENGPWITFLDEETRLLTQINAADVKMRVVCVLEASISSTLHELYEGPPVDSPVLCADV
jgi:hypothetical protein